jgi:hypothetical protein
MLKGALISYMPSFLTTVPNVIVFQISPETITHSWSQPAPGSQSADGERTRFDPLAVTGVPGEKFSFTLMMDANDEIADIATNPVAAGLATATGAYTHLAALEMLQFPVVPASTLRGQVSSAIRSFQADQCSAPTISVPASQLPVVLFVWGPQRILPVRVTQLQITEKLYDELLNPVQVEAQIELSVLTPDELVKVPPLIRGVANVAYVYTQSLRQLHAIANASGLAADTVIGMVQAAF